MGATMSTRRLAPRLFLVVIVLSLAVLSACAGRRIDHRVDRTRPETGRIGFTQHGHASWYGGKFHGRQTASGEIYDKHGLTAAHRELPLGTWVEVTHLANGRTVRVKVNDRGPFIRGRMLDLSRGAADALDMLVEGVAEVRIRVVPPPEVGTNPRTKPRPAPADGGTFAVQVGAFRDRDGALDVKRALEDAFDGVWIDIADGWHRVRLGRFSRGDAAEALRQRLTDAGYDAAVIRLP